MSFNIEFRIAGKSEYRTIVIDKPEHKSLLDIAMENDIDIDHACGGVCACSTCHVLIKQGLSSCNLASEEEEDQLDEAPGVGAISRLACQCFPNGKSNLIVEVPNWNRNLVREGR